VTLDMKPVYIVTGTPGKRFERRIREALGDACPRRRSAGAQADMFLLHQWIKKEPVDLLIGNTYGKYIARDEDIPFVRHGFPILDRVGHSYFPTVGYAGACACWRRSSAPSWTARTATRRKKLSN
jgi:nitrogenase molybdenum-iron protein beta chain